MVNDHKLNCRHPNGRLMTMAEAERWLIEAALAENSTPAKAAQALGIGRATIYRRITEWGLKDARVGDRQAKGYAALIRDEVPCHKCGEPVSEERAEYHFPTCFECQPPPEPSSIARPECLFCGWAPCMCDQQ